ncbi:MAG: holo-ACP synthase [Candidatus Omnitrophica bacterium]|nr:holo-ACP synthase [Candidatus Omnitrophota bacterium]
MIIGIGIDIIELSRIKKAIDRWGDDFLKHIFLKEEIAYAKKNKNPIQHYAVRFAAKEAVYKALKDTTDISWKNIKILNDKNGKPYCLINKKNFKHKVLISLSHTHNYAVANAIVTK